MKPTETPFLLSIPDAAAQLGIGRTSVYALVAVERLHVVHVGRRALIHSGEVERLARELAADAGAVLDGAVR